MEQVYRFEATSSDVVPIGVVPDGIRFDLHFTGTITDGPLTGGSVRGIDYLLIRADGVVVLDVREVITTPLGQHVSVRAYGYGIPPAEMQSVPPEVLLSPDFQWPDADIPLHGFVLCQTGDAALAWLNRTALVSEDTANLGTGMLTVTRSVTGSIPAHQPVQEHYPRVAFDVGKADALIYGTAMQ